MAKPTFDHVQFTPDQLGYLESLFPETIMPHTAPEAQLRHYNGQRSVVAAIKAKTRGYSAQDIPAPR